MIHRCAALFDPASLQVLKRLDMQQLSLGPEDYDACAVSSRRRATRCVRSARRLPERKYKP
jgi:hypothetical protein